MRVGVFFLNTVYSKNVDEVEDCRCDQ